MYIEHRSILHVVSMQFRQLFVWVCVLYLHTSNPPEIYISAGFFLLFMFSLVLVFQAVPFCRDKPTSVLCADLNVLCIQLHLQVSESDVISCRALERLGSLPGSAASWG